MICLEGYFSDGHDLLERVMDVSRRETERCDSPQGFQVYISDNDDDSVPSSDTETDRQSRSRLISSTT